MSQNDAIIPWLPALLGDLLHSCCQSLATSQKEFQFHWLNGQRKHRDFIFHLMITMLTQGFLLLSYELFSVNNIMWKMGAILKDDVTTYVPFCLSKGRLPWISLATSQTSKRKDGQKLLLGQPRKVRTFFFPWKRKDLTSKSLVLESRNLSSQLRSQTLDEVRSCSAKVITHPWHIWYLLMFSELSGLNQSCLFPIRTLGWEPASDKHVEPVQRPNQHLDGKQIEFKPKVKAQIHSTPQSLLWKVHSSTYFQDFFTEKLYERLFRCLQ